MQQPSRTFFVILGTVVLHAAAITLLERSDATPPLMRIQSTPLTFSIVEATIIPSEATALTQMMENSAETQSSETTPFKTSPPSKDTQQLSSSPTIDESEFPLPPSLPGLGLGFTKYFPSAALSTRPKAIDQPALMLEGIASFGQSKLTLYLNANGKVDEVIIDQTNLPPALSDAVREAFLKMQFSPGEIAGNAVPTVMKIEVDIDSPHGSK